MNTQLTLSDLIKAELKYNTIYNTLKEEGSETMTTLSEALRYEKNPEIIKQCVSYFDKSLDGVNSFWESALKTKNHIQTQYNNYQKYKAIRSRYNAIKKYQKKLSTEERNQYIDSTPVPKYRYVEPGIDDDKILKELEMEICIDGITILDSHKDNIGLSRGSFANTQKHIPSDPSRQHFDDTTAYDIVRRTGNDDFCKF